MLVGNHDMFDAAETEHGSGISAAYKSAYIK